MSSTELCKNRSLFMEMHENQKRHKQKIDDSISELTKYIERVGEGNFILRMHSLDLDEQLDFLERCVPSLEDLDFDELKYVIKRSMDRYHNHKLGEAIGKWIIFVIACAIIGAFFFRE